MIRTVLVFTLSVGCAHPPTELECEIGTASLATTAADRKILGAGADYDADATLRGRDDELRRSKRARRDVAWQTVAKVLAPIATRETLVIPATVPAWQTWYGGDDLNRLFQYLYEELGTEGRQARRHFTNAALDAAFGWNVTSVEELDNWPEERFLEYLASIDEGVEVAGLGGISPVSYSPGTTRHMLASYPEILQCKENGVPAAFTDSFGLSLRRMVREPLRLAECSMQTFGPYFVAASETLIATVDGDVELSVRDAEVTVCVSSGEAPCEATGPGTYWIDVAAGGDGFDGALAVDYQEPTPEWSACTDGIFPINAVVVKASWHRAQFGIELPVYDTSAERIAERLTGDANWGEGDSFANPGPDDIYTMRLANGNEFRLAALHIMTKELDHWQWITLWWSADPNTDFGEDRPVAVTQLGGPWKNYKMCAVSRFDERDVDPSGGYAATAPSLAAALAATHESSSWCSNPYIELGAGNAATNCIGCHQHGGTNLTSETILADPVMFPEHGRTELRNNFPTDYSYAVDNGDRIGQMFDDVVDYYDQFE